MPIFNNKEWMSLKNRFDPVYLNGVDEFVSFINRNNSEQLSTFPCPCLKCRNKTRQNLKDLRDHLIRKGFDRSYTTWTFHGENSVGDEIFEPVSSELPNQTNGLEDFIDNHYRMYGDNIGEGDIPSEPNANNSEYNKYKTLASEKLYPTCEGNETTLSAIVELHNLKKQFGWSGNSVSALLLVLKRWLPKENTLPEHYPHMKSVLKNLGMKANFIHACVNDCVLFYKEYEHLEECPKCGESRYVVKIKKGGRIVKEPVKVLRHFPLIPRLQRFFMIPWIAYELTWHHRATPSWDFQRHLFDSVQWKLCKEKWPLFSQDGRNVWLGIATDGFNPRGIQSSSYSCWPVITVPYNLPPSLCMKREFQMLSLLIPGPKAPGQDIDVYIEPLVDELKQLWDGVITHDSYSKEEFKMKALLLWGIHDFPAYGNLSGCVTHGYKACPVCSDSTSSIRLDNGRKIVYTDYRKFLSMDHPFRLGGFLGLRSADFSDPPIRINGDELLEKLSQVSYVPGKNSKAKKRKKTIENDNCAGSSLTETKAWYKKSILFDLEYWITHKVRHVIDVMHTVKNVGEHLIGTILDDKYRSKDNISSRLDMKALGIHSGQWLQTDPASGNRSNRKQVFSWINKKSCIFAKF